MGASLAITDGDAERREYLKQYGKLVELELNIVKHCLLAPTIRNRIPNLSRSPKRQESA